MSYMSKTCSCTYPWILKPTNLENNGKNKILYYTETEIS